MLPEEAGEIRHLLLQRGDLSLQGAQPLGQGQEGVGQRWPLAVNRSRRFLWQGSQAAVMQAGQQVQVLTAHPFFAAIMGMARHRKLSIGQPAAQRFGIDTQATTSVGYRDEGHKATPFVWNGQAEREPIWQTPGSFPRSGIRERVGEMCQENSPDGSREFSQENSLEPSGEG